METLGETVMTAVKLEEEERRGGGGKKRGCGRTRARARALVAGARLPPLPGRT